MIRARISKRFAPGRDSAGFHLEIEFEAHPGVTVLFGPSGAGKTLTLDCVAGFERPERGRILLDDRILFDAEAGVHLPPGKRNCGYVFQNYALFPHMTLRQNLEFAGDKLPKRERHRRVSEMLERFRLTDVAGRRPYALSGGQKQRCSIARALLGAPSLLLLDEPARGLDAPLRSELYEVLRQVRAEFPIPVLLVTHNLEESLELGDRMLVLREGRAVQSGSPREVLEHPATLDVARLLGVYNVIPAEIVALDPSRNSSRLRIDGHEIAGPYLRGHLRGDRIHLCAMPRMLRAAPRGTRVGPNEMPVRLARTVRLPGATRLEFDNGMAAEQPGWVTDERLRPGEEWVIELPPEAIRVAG